MQCLIVLAFIVWFLFHSNLGNVLFQRCVIVWNLVLIEMHKLMLCINGFHSFEVAFILPNWFINGWKNEGVCCEMIEVMIVKIWMEIAPWRAWRLRGCAGTWQRNEMVEEGWKGVWNLNQIEVAADRRSAVGSPTVDPRLAALATVRITEAAADRRSAVGQPSASRLLTLG